MRLIRPRRPFKLTVVLGAVALVIVAAALPSTADASEHSWWRWRHHHHQPPPPPPAPPSPSPSPSPSSGPTDPVPMPPGHGAGLPYDASRIPAGFKGYDFDNIKQTGEMPITSGDIDDTGAFRTVCKFSHMLPDDPIVHPNMPGASHLHTFFGNTGTNAGSTAESIANTGNGSCRGGTINRTGYWVPTVIDTKTGTPIGPDLMHVYYKGGYIVRPLSLIHPMPPGLRMVAGDAMASGKQNSPGEINWGCFDGGAGYDKQPVIHDCGTAPLSMNVEFPQCWNGKDLDSPDHRSHMAYAIEGKGCPADHPVAIPVISFHVLYHTHNVDISGWRLSSDVYDASKPGGYSIHGDWFYGWKPAIVDRWIPACVQRIATCGSHILGGGWVMDGDF